MGYTFFIVLNIPRETGQRPSALERAGWSGYRDAEDDAAGSGCQANYVHGNVDYALEAHAKHCQTGLEPPLRAPVPLLQRRAGHLGWMISTRRWKAKSAAISPNGICFPVEHVTEYAGSRETRLTGSWRNLEQQARDALDSVNVELSGAKDELERIAEEKKGLETLKKEKTEVEIEGGYCPDAHVERVEDVEGGEEWEGKGG
uniref:Uncharacterized protein n=1 Tax=Moniliophthora roreri TaxID=221103 RepID=A0A0W0G3X6_MONRR